MVREITLERTYAKIARFVHLPPEQRLAASEAASKFADDEEKWHSYTAFPRPQCDSEDQADQILDILDRTRVVKYSHDFTDLSDDSHESLRSTIEIEVRKPSERSKKLINALLPSYPTADVGFCSNVESGTIELSFIFQHRLPRWGDPTGSILLFANLPHSDSGVECFNLEVQEGFEQLEGDPRPRLLALMARLLDGAPASESTQISEQQFMTLLLQLCLGDKVGSGASHRFSHFAGVFAPDAFDEDYP